MKKLMRHCFNDDLTMQRDTERDSLRDSASIEDFCRCSMRFRGAFAAVHEPMKQRLRSILVAETALPLVGDGLG